MKKIIIYSSKTCYFCEAAKQIFDEEHLSYQEISIDNRPEIKEQMVQKANGKKTVPQIFFDNIHIGGYDQLTQIIKEGKFYSSLKD
mgnify:FL=1|tara:strand:+ start:216 stop:473 length:258 start_codon:yes stop_codon:yes gene_type:complete